MLVFGISKTGQLLKTIEQESFPVMTILPRPAAEVKMSYRMNFNNSALDLMLKHTWTIGQDVNEETGITKNFFINVANIPAGVVPNISFTVCNNGNVNNQKLWKHFREIFHNENDLLKYKLTTTTLEGITVLLFEEYNPTLNAMEPITLPEEVVFSEVPVNPVTASATPNGTDPLWSI